MILVVPLVVMGLGGLPLALLLALFSHRVTSGSGSPTVRRSSADSHPGLPRDYGAGVGDALWPSLDRILIGTGVVTTLLRFVVFWTAFETQNSRRASSGNLLYFFVIPDVLAAAGRQGLGKTMLPTLAVLLLGSFAWAGYVTVLTIAFRRLLGR